ncbi:MAG: pitrilysin family protein [Albidovulum sp.]
MVRALRLLIATAAVIAGSAPAFAAEVTSFSLDNGLEVVVIEDHRAPVVVQMLWYRAGAADEAPGLSGVAHYLEHLMFKGTETLAPGEFSKVVEANGGSDNAFTSWDYTGYFQRVAADRLELMMRMEADRMQGLILSEDDWQTEREVIIEERNQRVDSDPGAIFREQRNAAQYLNHPYGTPIIGWRHEMEALTRQDALDWYKRYYAPNAAVLIVAGDVAPDDVRRLAKIYYGPLKPSADITPRKRPQEPPQLTERRLSYSDPRVSQPYVTRSYLAPERDPGAQEKAAALTILADILGGDGQTSVLARKLQFDTHTAIYTSASYDGTAYDDTTFNLAVVPAEGVSLAEAEAALDDVLAEFLKTGIDPDQFASVKIRARAAMIYAEDNVNGLARQYGEALMTGLTLADVEAWPRILDGVTEADVLAAAAEVFDRRKAVTGWMMREGAQEVMQ